MVVGFEKMSVIDDLRKFLTTSKLVKSKDALNDNESLLEGGIIDSLAILEISTYIQNTYGVEVEDDDLLPENFDSLAAIACYVDRKRAQRSP